ISSMSTAASQVPSKPGAIVVMGVSGCGKTAVGAALAERLGVPFIEGDQHHPQANIDKMTAGIPLDDEDRWPWLAVLGGILGKTARENGGSVLACSALRGAYRRCLAEAAGLPLRFVFLDGSRALLESRMRDRPGHYMPVALLDSQLATLEAPGPDEDAITVDIDEPLAALVKRIAGLLAAG
ncbi:MAG TPA: gluconokinase, partial [Afifellaceae bacterium]|nr:gluconokinase [Afifellaceae bacterium]